MDYVLHFQAFRAWGGSGSAAPVYRHASLIAGMLAVGLLIFLVRRLDWEPWRRVLLVGLFLFSGPVLLFCGYVESYSFLFVFLTCFLVTGILVLDGRAPLWLASAFFGLAIFFHLTAVFTGPALLFLALRAPAGSVRGRWLQAAAPVAVSLAIAGAAHLATGYDRNWFQMEFLDSENTRNIWLGLGGAWGLFSLNHLLLQLNLLLITAPACLAVVVARFHHLRGYRNDPRIQFLVLQVVIIALCSLVIDRKLGGARDWDLLAAHSAGLMLLAALVITPLPEHEPVTIAKGKRGTKPASSPDPAAALVLTVAFLCTLPWVLLGRSETASVARFADAAAGFPPKIQAYALEDLGNFYTSAKDFEHAALMLERSLGADPDNVRRYTLLGSAYRHLADDPGTLAGPRAGYLRKAEDSYRESLRRNPDNGPALEDLGRLLMQRQDFRAAGDLYARAVRLDPNRAEAWEGLGYCLLDQQAFSGAAEAFGRTLDLGGSDRVRGPLGIALTRLERFPEAQAMLQEALRRGNTALATMMAYADCLVSWAEHRIATGQGADDALLDEAESLTRRLLGQNPGAPDLAALQDRLETIRAASSR